MELLRSPILPRHLFKHDYTQLSLHIFCDASYSAFAAVALFVYDLPNTDSFDTVFVLGKVRFAPLKQHTITELELQVAVLGTRIPNFVQQPIRNTNILLVRQHHRHTMDSKLTQTTTIFFIANRVSEILQSGVTVLERRH